MGIGEVDPNFKVFYEDRVKNDKGKAFVSKEALDKEV